MKKFALLLIPFMAIALPAAQQPMVYSQSVVLASDHPAIATTTSSTAPTTAATLTQGIKAPAATGTPEALVAAPTLVHSVLIRAGRTARVANTGSVWIGVTSTNDAQLIELVPGAILSMTAPPGKYIDLATIYVDSVTLTDGVIFIATQ